jgi:preprotein translocase subunit SecF
MIPLIVHHQRIIDPYDITVTTCAETWQQNMNARLAYDFILLFVLFILPLTLMTYCYVRISFSLWFIDSNGRTSLSASSTTNVARFSTISEDFPQIDINDTRRQSSQKHRPYYIHYHKKYENDSKRKQQKQEKDEYRSLMSSTGRKLTSHRPRRSTTMNDVKLKSFSITTTTTTNAHTITRRSSSLIGRRFGENGYIYNNFNEIQQGRQIPIRHRQSTSPYTSGILRTSLTSLQSQNRIIGSTNLSTNGHNNNNHHHHRSIVDVERASRFLQSRRRVVKLLITLGKISIFSRTKLMHSFSSLYSIVIVFFITRLPLNIVSIYIDLTSHTYIPQSTFSNGTKSETTEDEAAAQTTNADKKMTLVLYVNPILQLFSLSNSAINPLCYCLMSHAVKNIITLIRQKLRRRGQKKATSIPLTQRPIPPIQSIKMMVHNRNSHGIDGLVH